ncbi:uncharacterized protein BDR25DRAFT_385633, partial [Lindgomyces ingoldianus]
CILTVSPGYRAKQLEWKKLKTLNLTRTFVLILYLLAITFVFTAAVLENGLQLSSAPACSSAIIICLIFYVSSKGTMYVFLVERAHVMRAPYVRRVQDWIWLGGILMITMGFGSIAICAFTWPIAELSPDDGRCRIGLPLKVAIPLLSFDVIINLALTGIFIYLMRSLLQFSGMPNSTATLNSTTRGLRRILHSAGRQTSPSTRPRYRNSLKPIEALLRRTLIGSVLVTLSTIGNHALLYTLKGRELAWLCLTMCIFDGKISHLSSSIDWFSL